MTQRHSSSKHKGDWAEQAARQWLQQRGFRIEAYNVRYRVGEIDIVAWEQEVLCFVEVRSRQTDRLIVPATTVRHVKQQRIIRAASTYMQRHFANKSLPSCRFDVVSVVGYDNSHRIWHIRSAFEQSGASSNQQGGPWPVC
ncbi:MAG: YraN family protein [Myxococcota bacterium]